MIYFIIILIISQIASFYFIFNKIKPIIKPNGIILKPIPKDIKYEDVDTDNKLIRDIMESIKMEKWKVLVIGDLTFDNLCYDLNIVSNSNDVHIRCRIRVSSYHTHGELPYISTLSISTDKHTISPNTKSHFSNEILSFLWDYIIDYHNDINNKSVESYTKSIIEISSKLKGLNRDRKLNQIL